MPKTRPRTPAEIGDIIRAERKRRGWSQRDLAGMADTNQTTIAMIELGLRFPKRELLHELAKLLTRGSVDKLMRT